MKDTLTIEFPAWLPELLERSPSNFGTQEERMRFVVALARENVERKTGGPFGAGIFDSRGNLVAPGINLVIPENCSILHAEMVAIAFAQRMLQRYNLRSESNENYELVSSCEPCAMCFGAIPWSGVTSLVCGARDEDARAIGFDEGAKLPRWREALEHRGIEVRTDVLREQAAEVLNLYAESDGTVYSP